MQIFAARACSQWESCCYELNCAEEHFCLLFIVITRRQQYLVQSSLCAVVDTSKHSCSTESFSTSGKVPLFFTLCYVLFFHVFVLQDGYKAALSLPTAASSVFQHSQKATLS